MLGKVLSGIVGSRVAEKSGQSGALGAAAGVVAARIIKRSPLSALLIGGAWAAHALYKHKKERDEDAAALNAKPAKVVKPSPKATATK